MKILKSWLREYLPSEISLEKIEEILTAAGVEIEKIDQSLDDKIIVAEIKSIKPHPNADKLQVVDIFDGQHSYSVVCGANNIQKGQLVPLAKIGAIIQGVEIKEATIRGEKSQGMLCSESELGIGDDHSGIYILQKDYQIGRRLNSYHQSDNVIEISPTANRGDCLSHIGVARELAAYQNSSIRREPIKLTKSDPEHASREISVEVKNSSLCPRYMARVVKGVKVAPSPKWLQERLIACGAKPINNVVDITNYILLDLGHPMHAFDGSKITDSKLIIRQAKNSEDIVTLDGENRNLDKEMLVISDKNGPVAIAGIMGGKNSEVDDNTHVVVLEAADFNSANIRATSKKLKLSTEASFRFERGIDSGGIEYAINKAADMIANICGGRVMSGFISIGDDPVKHILQIEYDKIRELLGLEISDQEIDHLLRLLGFVVKDCQCEVPTWRHDINIWQDLAEEVGRLVGYDKIKLIPLKKTQPRKTFYYRTEKIKDALVSYGYSETINYPFLSEQDLDLSNLESKNLLEIANPLQPENKYLRNSLIPGLLKNIAKNPAFDQVNLFEVGHIFKKTVEEQYLAIASTSNDFDTFGKSINNLINDLALDTKLLKLYHYRREELSNYKIKRPYVTLAEISLSKAYQNKRVDQKINLKSENKQVIYRGVSKYPSSTRDLAFIVDKKTPADQIESEIYKTSDLVNRVELFDEFSSDKIGKNKKNLAFHIFFQSFEKTLSDSETNQLVSAIVKRIEKQFKAKLRG